jgi:hypothetical protein
MSQLLGGGQILVGLGLIVGWWLALRLVGKLNRDKRMTALGLVGGPCVFLLWFVGAGILILRGMSAV